MARICVIERRKVLLYITDQIHDRSLLEWILSDLLVLMNCGGLPLRIFAQQLLNELGAQLSQFSQHETAELCASELRQRELISRNIQTNLRIVISANGTSLRVFQVTTTVVYVFVGYYCKVFRKNFIRFSTTRLLIIWTGGTPRKRSPMQRRNSTSLASTIKRSKS